MLLSQDLIEEDINNYSDHITVYADEIPSVNAVPVLDSDYEGGTTEDELNEAVGVPNYHPRCSADSLSSGPGSLLHPCTDRQLFVTTFITDSIPDRAPVS